MMQAIDDIPFGVLVEQYLGTRLPQDMTETFTLSKLPPEAQDFIGRALTLMKQAGYSATDFSPHLIRWLSVSVPSVLPYAWEGRIPPLTLPGRHKKLDDYIVDQVSATPNEPNIYVDMGCGFPPVTTADTAQKFTHWHIYGVDRSFSDYVLYDNDGHYACFDQKGRFQYFQAFMEPSGRALYANPDATRKQFNALFESLFPLLQDSNETTSETVEKNGHKLIHNHIRDFETNNLTFIKSDIEKLRLPPAKVIRCMNVLIYFKPDIRKKMLAQVAELLDEDGILIAGTNGLSIQSRYAVYQKSKGGLIPNEFAFGLDNLGPIVFMPFFTIHENDPEAALLADLTRAIRSDRSWIDFNNRVDGLLEYHDVCSRGEDGFLHFPEKEMPLDEYFKKGALLWRQIAEEGYLNRAVEILGKAGYEAWENPVGDIAVRPASWVKNGLP